MAKFELYENREYRRAALDVNDGVYCIIASADSQKKRLVLPALEFSQMGFKVAVPPEKKAEFFGDKNLTLKAIAGSRNLVFAKPIAFKLKWQNLDLKNEILYAGCMISDISPESENQFAAFVRSELKFGGKWGQRQPQALPKDLDLKSNIGPLKGMPTESEDQYSSLFENNHAVMLLIDPDDGDIVDANLAAVSYYGWSHDELTQKKITDLNTLTSEQVHKEMDLAKKQQRRYFLFQHCLANGEIRNVEVYSGPIKLSGKLLLYSIIHDITGRIEAEQERERLIVELQKALKEIKALRGILPLCSFCKKIRDEQGQWQTVDAYISKYSQANISHSICPECAKNTTQVYSTDSR